MSFIDIFNRAAKTGVHKTEHSGLITINFIKLTGLTKEEISFLIEKKREITRWKGFSTSDNTGGRYEGNMVWEIHSCNISLKSLANSWVEFFG